MVFPLISFIGYFSQKVMDYVEIYAGNWEKIIKHLLFLLFLKDHSISTKTYYLKNDTTILHYQQHKKYTIFYYSIYTVYSYVRVTPTVPMGVR